MLVGAGGRLNRANWKSQLESALHLRNGIIEVMNPQTEVAQF